MPRKIAPQIRRLIERNAHKDMSAPQMRRALERHAAENQVAIDIPSVRAISDILVRSRQQPIDERLKVTEVIWPDSFEDGLGLLPWESTGAYFELLRELDGRRPLYPLAKWFWRLTRSIPDTTIDLRRRIAGDLAIWECLPIPESRKPDPRLIEIYLTFKPWRSDEDERAYLADIPEERRYNPYSPNWALKTTVNGEVEQLRWYGVELYSGVFTLDARDRFLTFVKDSKDLSQAEIQSPRKGSRR